MQIREDLFYLKLEFDIIMYHYDALIPVHIIHVMFKILHYIFLLKTCVTTKLIKPMYLPLKPIKPMYLPLKPITINILISITTTNSQDRAYTMMPRLLNCPNREQPIVIVRSYLAYSSSESISESIKYHKIYTMKV